MWAFEFVPGRGTRVGGRGRGGEEVKEVERRVEEGETGGRVLGGEVNR